MEWSLYPELVQTLGTRSQGLPLFHLNPSGNAGTSPGGNDESEFGLGVTASSLSEFLTDSGPPSLSDMLAWEPWDAGGFGADATAAITPPSGPDAGQAHGGGIPPIGNNIRTHPSNAADAPRRRRCSNPANPCLAAAANAISALHTCADMCLSSSPPGARSSSTNTSNNGNGGNTTTATSNTAGTTTNANHAGGPRTLDAMLTSSRDATYTISATLECSTCSSQPQLHLLAATALEKLIGWYRAVVEGVRRGSGSGPTSSTSSSSSRSFSCSSSSSLSSSPPSSSSSTETGNGTTTSSSSTSTTTATTRKPKAAPHTYHQHQNQHQHTLPPIAIGTHAVVDEAIQAAIVAQVVLQRLRELKGVAEQLALRMGEEDRGKEGTAAAQVSMRTGPGPGPGLDRRLPEAVRDRLVARLRQGLVAAWEELAVALREGQQRGGGGLY